MPLKFMLKALYTLGLLRFSTLTSSPGDDMLQTINYIERCYDSDQLMLGELGVRGHSLPYPLLSSPDAPNANAPCSTALPPFDL